MRLDQETARSVREQGFGGFQDVEFPAIDVDLEEDAPSANRQVVRKEYRSGTLPVRRHDEARKKFRPGVGEIGGEVSPLPGGEVGIPIDQVKRAVGLILMKDEPVISVGRAHIDECLGPVARIDELALDFSLVEAENALRLCRGIDLHDQAAGDAEADAVRAQSASEEELFGETKRRADVHETKSRRGTLKRRKRNLLLPA